MVSPLPACVSTRLIILLTLPTKALSLCAIPWTLPDKQVFQTIVLEFNTSHNKPPSCQERQKT